MLKVEKIQKVKPFGSGENTMVSIRDGQFSTPKTRKLLELRE
jgi:hypothetical protein